MTIALMLQKYLDAKNVRYDLMRHEPTSSSMETAEVCHVSGDCIAKGVLYVMKLAMHSLYCRRRTTLGSQRSRASLAKMLSWPASVRRPNYSRTAREVPSRLWESAMA